LGKHCCLQKTINKIINNCHLLTTNNTIDYDHESLSPVSKIYQSQQAASFINIDGKNFVVSRETDWPFISPMANNKYEFRVNLHNKYFSNENKMYCRFISIM
jgi:hypothetical protein